MALFGVPLLTFALLQSVAAPPHVDGIVAGVDVAVSRSAPGLSSDDMGLRWRGRVGWRRSYEQSALVVDFNFDGVSFAHRHPNYQSYDQQSYYRLMFGIRGELRAISRLVFWFGFRLGLASAEQSGVDCPLENYCHNGITIAVDVPIGLNVQIVRWVAAGPFVTIGVPGGIPDAGAGLTLTFP